MNATILALDLERTLISDAFTVVPRPGLFDFLEFCLARFERIVLFTCVEKPDALAILRQLSSRGCIPPAFMDRLEYVEWTGDHKDLGFIPNAVSEEVLLVDDDAGWVRPDQRDRWVPITPYYDGEDDELLLLRSVLEAQLDGRTSSH